MTKYSMEKPVILFFMTKESSIFVVIPVHITDPQLLQPVAEKAIQDKNSKLKSLKHFSG